MTHVRIRLLIAIVLGAGALLACKSSSTPSSSGVDSRSALQDLVAKLTTREVKAAYNYTDTYNSGPKGQPSTTTDQGTFTFYSKPPDWRWDVTIGSTAASIISAGGNSYLCTPDNGGTCSKQPANASGLELEAKLYEFLASSPSTAIPLPFLSLFAGPQVISITDYDFPAIDRSSKTVAGQHANCFSLAVATYNLQAFEVCFSSNGVLLSLTDSSGGDYGESSNLEATSVSGTVADSDLTPPYPVQ